MGRTSKCSPTISSPISEVSIFRRKTSENTTANDLMNTAFYEPDEVEDQWDKRLDELEENHPILMFYIIPFFIQLLLILLIAGFFSFSGAANILNELAAYLYYCFICFMF